jgi:DNA-binding response OmpR family regulator
MMELALLRAFINAPQRTLNRKHLVQETRIRGTDITRSLDGIIHRLRGKLPGIIQTRRGEGYVFSVPVERV